MNTSPSTARLRPFRPQPFGRYTLLSHLATGGMGEIYLARLEGAQGFEKLCVIKKILPQLAEDKEFVDRFVGEARTLVKLSHGSIAQVLDMGLHEGDAYMALEYVDGKDLRKVAGRVRDRQMPLPLTFVLFVMGRVLDALAYAHRKRDDDEKEINLVHRDISPQNILISYEGEVKVVDFGLAKSRLSAAKTNPSIILGKFLYMSPEQARHQQVDRRSDLYAVGLCLYELIAGQNPFDSVHSGELMSAVANPRIAPLNEVEPFTPPPVSQLVMKALAVDPAQRFQTAEEFRGRLISVLMEIDPVAGPETVSRFMRDVFAAEFQSERKLLAQLKEVPRVLEPLPPRSELDTDPGARFPPPSLPAKTIKLDPPSQPLSFQPTPRSRQGASVHEEETRPGVAVSTPEPSSPRPATSFEQLDATARSRVRPSMSSTSPTTETVTVTVEPRSEAPERPPAPALASAAPAPSRQAAATVEVPIPYVPPAAIPPGVTPPAVTAGTAKTLEAPRTPLPPAPSSPPALGARAAPASGTHALRNQELVRSMAPTILTPTVGGPEQPGPGLGAPPPPAAPAALTPPAPSLPAREPSAPPEPLQALIPQAEGARADASRRGLDDTHPSYQLATGKPPEDTQPRVVLDESALSGHEESEGEIITSGVLEEAATPRPKPMRRGRVSSAGMPSVGRVTTGSRAPVRPTVPAEGSEPEDSGSVPIVVEEGAEAPRDPRDDTRKTPIPTRPGEPSRRAPREESRKAPPPAPARKGSKSWLVVSLVLLGVAGVVVVVLRPQLEHLWKQSQKPPGLPPPAVPIRPVPVPSGPPGMVPAAPPVVAPAPVAPPAPVPAAPAVEAGAEDGDVFVPLPSGLSSTPKKAAATRPAKKGPRSKEATELLKDMNAIRSVYTKATREQPCENSRIAVYCQRYDELDTAVKALGDGYDPEVHKLVKRLRRAMQQ